MTSPPRDLVTAGATALFAAVYLYLGWDLEAGVEQGVPGPGAFPRLLGMGMLLAAAYLGSRGLLREWQRGGRPAAGAVSRPAPSRGVMVLYGLFVLYVAAMPIVGFALATFAFAAVGMRVTFGMPLWRSAAYGALLTLFAQGLFGVGLGVPLPAGRLW